MFYRPTVALGLVLALTATATAQCTRDQLLASAELYVEAQASGRTDDLAKVFASDVAFRQNNNATTLADSLLSKALKLDHNRTIADTTACATYTELVSTAGPYVVGTQIRYSADGAAITLIDIIAATTGDWLFNAAGSLRYFATEDWGTLPEAERSPRDVLQAAADAYLDMWSNSTAIDAVPWGTPCARTEGGMHTSPSCKAGAPTRGSPNTKVTDRRYVIDETVGSCEVHNAFAGGLPDAHEFRLVSGKLVLVHTITA